MTQARQGIFFATGAYLLWGFFPIYWKALGQVPAGEVLAHRILWSCLFLAGFLLTRTRRAHVLAALRNRRARLGIAAAALLISVNWLTYIWAVNSGHVLESSLGYFINPLFSVLLGVLVLRERLRPLQWIPLALAALGVLLLTLAQGRLPWIALTLAVSFSLYGLVKKTTALGSLTGQALETALLFLPALGWILLQTPSAPPRPAPIWILLVCAGPVTAVPLLLFAAGARRIPLWQTGLLQYLAPSLQFMLGVWLYHEELGPGRLPGFLLVWSGLALFAAESLWRARLRAPLPADS
ncbi:MAG: EamA family transporter RarD [Candidatus Delongbacteria bacterium]